MYIYIYIYIYVYIYACVCVRVCVHACVCVCVCGGLYKVYHMSHVIYPHKSTISTTNLCVYTFRTSLYIFFILVLGATCVRSYLLDDYMIAEKVSSDKDDAHMPVKLHINEHLFAIQREFFFSQEGYLLF